MARYHALLLAAGCCLCASCLPLGDANDTAESLVLSRGGKVTRDESLLSRPASAAESRFKGAVVDDGGRPVAGAEVVCLAENYGSDEGWLLYRQVDRATTDVDGTFSVRAAGGDARQRNTIAARKAGLAIGWVAGRKPEGEALRVVMGPPVTLAGVVVDEAGKPVAGAEVRASTWRKVAAFGGGEQLSGLAPFDWLVATTDAQGRFEFKNLNRDSALLHVTAAGYATINTPSYPKTELERSPAGQCRIVLPRESVLRGTVVEAEPRRPVAGVKVLVSSNTERGVSSPGSPVVTAADGTFVARNLVEGKCYVRLAHPAEGLPDWAQVKSVEAKTGDPGVVVEVTKGGILEVLVTDAHSGLPVEGAWMRVGWESPGGPPPNVPSTGKDGIARARVGEGKYVLDGLIAQYFSNDNTRREVQVAYGRVRQVAIQLHPLLKVQGTVIDADGKPVEGAVIWMETGWGEPKTDSAGRFDIFCEPSRSMSGRPVIIARHIGRGLAVLELLTEARPPVLRMAPGAEIAGRAIDPRGNPVADADVLGYLWTQNWQMGTFDLGLTTDCHGRFVVKAIPNQAEFTVRFAFIREGFEGWLPSRDSYEVAVGPGMRRIEPKDFVLESLDQTITGVAVDAAGKPVAGARVWASHSYAYGGITGDVEQHEAQSAADGTFTLKGLTRREYDVGASTPDNQMSEPMKAKGGARDVRITVRAR